MINTALRFSIPKALSFVYSRFEKNNRHILPGKLHACVYRVSPTAESALFNGTFPDA